VVWRSQVPRIASQEVIAWPRAPSSFARCPQTGERSARSRRTAFPEVLARFRSEPSQSALTQGARFFTADRDMASAAPIGPWRERAVHRWGRGKPATMAKFTARYERIAGERGWSVVISRGRTKCSASGLTLASARISIRRELGLALGLEGFAELLARPGAHAAAVPAALAKAGVEIEEDVQLPASASAMVAGAREACQLSELAQQHALKLQQLAAEQLAQADIDPLDFAWSAYRRTSPRPGGGGFTASGANAAPVSTHCRPRPAARRHRRRGWRARDRDNTRQSCREWSSAVALRHRGGFGFAPVPRPGVQWLL
jgi:hypothetical protein